MKITLLRHAIAIDKDLGINDFDRPLTPKGRKRCLSYLEQQYDIISDIDYVLCSPSVRTRQTWGLLSSLITLSSEQIEYDEEIYEFSDGQLLWKIIENKLSGKQHICLIGHNESISLLASKLLGQEIHMKKGTLITTEWPS